jgi:hypothetical protein
MSHNHDIRDSCDTYHLCPDAMQRELLERLNKTERLGDRQEPNTPTFKLDGDLAQSLGSLFAGLMVLGFVAWVFQESTIAGWCLIVVGGSLGLRFLIESTR